jgi:hypothetical protein
MLSVCTLLNDTQKLMKKFFVNTAPPYLNTCKILLTVTAIMPSVVMMNVVAPLKVTRNSFFSGSSVSIFTLYRLFCLFNRFCDPEENQLILTGKSVAFVFKTLGLNPPEADTMDLEQVSQRFDR